MGYYTRVGVVAGETTIEQALAVVYPLLEMIDQHVDCIFGENEGPEESAKWNAAMTVLSKLFPDSVFALSFELSGEGELWKKYFKNGEVYRREK